MTRSAETSDYWPNPKDIAANANVFRSTVSRDSNTITAAGTETHHDGLPATSQAGTAPHLGPQSQGAPYTRVIGVVIPQVSQVLFEDAYYFPALLHGITKSAKQHDYAILLWFGQSHHDETMFLKRVTGNTMMDGTIIASARSDSPLIDHFLRSNIPFVLVERPVHQQDAISFVTIDNFQSARTVVSHLVSLGRKRIGIITGDLKIIDAVDRLAGYKQALNEASLPIDDALVVEGDFTPQAGYDGMCHLLAHGVDGVFTSSDIIAQGALEALKAAAVRVPEDVALVSIDDLPTAVQVTPKLTTMRHPVEEKGAYAVEVLLKMIEEHETVPRQIVLPTRLIVRESCGANGTH